MKSPAIRVTLMLTFLLMLGAIFGGLTSTPTYAATTSTQHSAKAALPSDLPTRVDCNNAPDLIIIADNNTNKDCFAGVGIVPVTIYNVTYACVYNGHGAVLEANHNESVFFGSNGCVDRSQNPINVVTGIDID